MAADPSRESQLQRCVLVGNIPYSASEEQLQEIFESVGTVLSFRLVRNPDTGQTKGLGLCEFRDSAAAEEAVKRLNSYEMNGRVLKVDRAANSNQLLAGPSLAQLAGSGNDPKSNEGGAAGGNQMSAITQRIDSMTAMQMYTVMGQLRGIVEKNKDQAKKLLTENPHLSIAFLRIQERLRMLNGLVLPPPSADPPPAPIVPKTEPPADPRMSSKPDEVQQAAGFPPQAMAVPPAMNQPHAGAPPFWGGGPPPHPGAMPPPAQQAPLMPQQPPMMAGPMPGGSGPPMPMMHGQPPPPMGMQQGPPHTMAPLPGGPLPGRPGPGPGPHQLPPGAGMPPHMQGPPPGAPPPGMQGGLPPPGMPGPPMMGPPPGMQGPPPGMQGPPPGMQGPPPGMHGPPPGMHGPPGGGGMPGHPPMHPGMHPAAAGGPWAPPPAAGPPPSGGPPGPGMPPGAHMAPPPMQAPPQQPPPQAAAAAAPGQQAAPAAGGAPGDKLAQMLASLSPAQVEQLKILVQLPPQKLDEMQISAQQKALVATLRVLWQQKGPAQ